MKMNLNGQKIGRWTVLKRETPRIYRGHTYSVWLCRCECGRVRAVPQSNLRSGDSVSCGCYRAERTGQRRRKHGYAGTRLYRIWTGMLMRCRHPENKMYERYAGRGVKVCRRWYKFENFLSDMGEPSPGKTLDRVNNNGNYCKANCRWVSRKTQANNRGTNVVIDYRGRRKTLSQWVTALGLNYKTVHTRLNKYRWTVQDAFTCPVIVGGTKLGAKIKPL